MLIAVFLAITVHMFFLNFKFEPKPVLLPKVPLPRSVSVFLGQKKVVEAPAVQTEKAQTVKRVFEQRPAAETEQEKQVVQNKPVIKEKKASPLQHPVLTEKTVRQPIVEKSMPATQRIENKNTMPDPVSNAKDQVYVASEELWAEQNNNNGVALPGTLQMAYPRYQLNAPPTYPALARKRGQKGTVILQVLVNKNGRVEDLMIDTSSNFALLDSAALKAVRKWSFEPGRRGEEKEAMWVRVPVTFKLKK
jgi:protein TonB